MWHRPFGILIDATCYNGQNEPQDAIFKKLDLLTPSELSKHLSRVYVYNMNSAFRYETRMKFNFSTKSSAGNVFVGYCAYLPRTKTVLFILKA